MIARMLTVRQACAYIGVHPSTYYRNRDEYPFTLKRVPGCRHPKIDRKDIDAFLDSMEPASVGKIVGKDAA